MKQYHYSIVHKSLFTQGVYFHSKILLRENLALPLLCERAKDAPHN
nr:MAG TPA: hypothetical protein [Caudoviricetes sp.]